MTPQTQTTSTVDSLSELRVKVATLRGATWGHPVYNHDGKWHVHLGNPPFEFDSSWAGKPPPFDECVQELDIPNYPSDLNACAETVASMRPEDANRWADELTRITAVGANPHWSHWFHLATATAEQRCRAFVALHEEMK